MSNTEIRAKRGEAWSLARIWGVLTRNSIYGLVAGLLSVSFFMTWVGVSDFIKAQSATAPDAQTMFGIGLVVLMLTLGMFWALRELIARRSWPRIIASGVLYVGLLLFSVSFGYGFWWTLIAGREATEASLEASVSALEVGSDRALTALRAVESSVARLAELSQQQADVEDNRGGSCGASSATGQGPLYSRRMSVNTQLQQSAESIRTQWVEPLQTEVASIRTRVAAARELRNVAERRTAFEAIARDAASLSRRFANMRETFGADYAGQFRQLATEFDVPPGATSFTCHDSALAGGLRRAVTALEADMSFEAPEFTFAEGEDATALSVIRLWSSIGDAPASLWRTITGGVDNSEEASTQVSATLDGRNLAALALAFGIDMSLLFFTIIAPRPPFPQGGLVGPLDEGDRRKLRQVIEIAIREDPDATRRTLSRCVLTARGGSYFILPDASVAPPELRPRMEAFDNVANALVDIFGERLVSPRWRPHAYAAGQRRLAELGWAEAQPEDFDLYMLSRGGFAAIRAEIWAEPERVPDPSIEDGETARALPHNRAPTLDELWASWPGRRAPTGSPIAPPSAPEAAPSVDDLDKRWFEYKYTLELAAREPQRTEYQELAVALLQSFRSMTERAGVSPIIDVGAAFDATRHDAKDQRPSASPRGTVIEIQRPGYERGGRVERTAWVALSSGDSMG